MNANVEAAGVWATPFCTLRAISAGISSCGGKAAAFYLFSSAPLFFFISIGPFIMGMPSCIFCM